MKKMRTFCHLCWTNLNFQVRGENCFSSTKTGNLEAGAALSTRQQAHDVKREVLTEQLWPWNVSKDLSKSKAGINLKSQKQETKRGKIKVAEMWSALKVTTNGMGEERHTGPWPSELGITGRGGWQQNEHEAPSAGKEEWRKWTGEMPADKEPHTHTGTCTCT